MGGGILGQVHWSQKMRPGKSPCRQGGRGGRRRKRKREQFDQRRNAETERAGVAVTHLAQLAKAGYEVGP